MERPYRDLDYGSRIKTMQETQRTEDENIRLRYEQQCLTLNSLYQWLEKADAIQQQSDPTIRNDLGCCEQRLEEFSKSIKQMEDNYKRSHQEFRNGQRRGEPLNVLYERIDQMMKTQQWEQERNRFTLTEIETHVEDLNQRIQKMEASCQQQYLFKRIKELKAELQTTRCICEGKHASITNLTQRITELTAELQTMSADLKEKDEELKSFKDRVAEQVAPSIKTGKVLSLNSPVTKSRIQEMYDDLRSDWPQIKDSLKSTYDADTVKRIIQEKFEYARAEIEKKKEQADRFFKMDYYSSVEPSQKIEQFIQLNIQNLQLSIYNQKCNPGSKKPDDGLEYLRSECYWLGCLMALNNPPLQPDWGNHPQSLDKWDILPRHISVYSERNQDNREQQSMFCSHF